MVKRKKVRGSKKNIAGQDLKNNPRNRMKNRPNVPDQQINSTISAKKTKSRKLRN